MQSYRSHVFEVKKCDFKKKKYYLTAIDTSNNNDKELSKCIHYYIKYQGYLYCFPFTFTGKCKNCQQCQKDPGIHALPAGKSIVVVTIYAQYDSNNKIVYNSSAIGWEGGISIGK